MQYSEYGRGRKSEFERNDKARSLSKHGIGCQSSSEQMLIGISFKLDRFQFKFLISLICYSCEAVS